MQICTLIVDDEPLACVRLRELLQSDPDVVIVGEGATGEDALRLVAELRPHLIFLDIQMPGLDGLSAIRRAEPPIPIVVFVTAFDQYAVDAFDVSALDFLVKPVRRDRLHATLKRVKSALEMKQLEDYRCDLITLVDNLKLKANSRSLAVKSGHGYTIVPLEEVLFLQAERDYVRIQTRDRAHLMRERMHLIEKKLAASDFVRIHRSLIVNSRHVKQILPLASGEFRVGLSSGAWLTGSRRYRKSVDELLGTSFRSSV